MGRRSGFSTTERAFRQEFAQTLREAIGTKRGAASQAAVELRISRQALSLYLSEKATPSGEVVRRACKRWGLTLNVEGHVVSEKSYPPQSPGPVPAHALQLPLLPDALDSLKDSHLKVRIVRKLADSVELEVKIDFGR